MCSRTTAVNVKTQDYDVYLGRAMPGRAGSPYGNPFKVGRDGSLTEVLSKYKSWLESQPELMTGLAQYKGLRLGCWCKPKACHVDIIVELIEGSEPAPQPPAQQSLF